jgi:prepilin-type N-terminal cleavage/methylation domain-containing protein
VRTKFKSNQGVTLLEVVITTVVIGILASLSAPSVVGMLARSDSKSAVQIIQSAIQEAKREAIRNSKSCEISVAFSKRIDWNLEIRANKDGCLKNVDNEAPVAMTVELPENVSFATSNLPVDKSARLYSSFIQFNRKGVVMARDNTPTLSEPAVIVVAAEGANSAECIVISPVLGLIRTGRYTGKLENNEDPSYEALKSYAPSTSTELPISKTKQYCQVDI